MKQVQYLDSELISTGKERKSMSCNSGDIPVRTTAKYSHAISVRLSVQSPVWINISLNTITHSEIISSANLLSTVKHQAFSFSLELVA